MAQKIKSIWDNGGRTLDRYTVVTKTASSRSNMCLTLSNDPVHEFAQWGVGEEGTHLGDKVELSQLPPNVQAYIIKVMQGL